jgi:acetoacetyl-CoA synthetase
MPSDPVWSPDAERVAASRLHQFIERYASGAENYADLHRWSITHPAEFWRAVAAFGDLRLTKEPTAIVEDFERMPGARWFVGAELNYAANLLAGDPNRPAIVFANERGLRRELSLGELRRQVAAIARALRSFGVNKGDRVAGVLPNSPECIIAALATASIGAVWSSCSPDFGSASLLDRLIQIEPKVLFGVNGYDYAGKTIDCLPTLWKVVARLPSVTNVVVTEYAASGMDTDSWPGTHAFEQLAAIDAALEFESVEFAHPLFIMFSSGTTGPPKCIVHSVGGTLLQHLKEHQLHTDIGPGDRVFYYTTTGWMMWNWLLSSLASGATLVLYDGAPLYPEPAALWRLAENEGINVFGTSARYLSALEKSGFAPGDEFELAGLKSILSTGSPLAPASFDFVYRCIKRDLMLASIAGGTDLISCFVLGNPMLPVYRGEIQCIGLGMDVRILDSDGHAVVDQKGELVCGSPFPSMPVGFWNDPIGIAYRSAYFERYPSVWHHGDFALLTEHGGVIMFGRSDSTLNPGGIRIGTAEIYRILDQIPEIVDSVVVGQAWENDTRVVLFIVLADKLELNAATEKKIRAALRAGASPHHVPARIVAVSDIPRTLSGKISERAVSDALHGRAIGNLTALANPEAIAEFHGRPELES